jgi:pre-rRNA-processing protein TSR2
MAQVRPQGPTLASSNGPPIPSRFAAHIDLLVSLHLWSWPALSLAIQNGWGGDHQVSADKRDWLAGAVSDLLISSPSQITDVADLEEVLLQVMLDEFEIVVDDGSADETARKIWASAEKVQKGEVKELEEMYAIWHEKRGTGGDKATGIMRGEDKDGDETDWDNEDDEEEEWNGLEDKGDVDMAEAPQLVDAAKQKQRIEPEVDEDGFTKVVAKKKR